MWRSRCSVRHASRPLASALARRNPGTLFDRVREKFTAPGVASLEWRMFYPVGKAYLARNVANSLVTTYQNKYTFHRSLVLGAVVVFWLSAFALITAAVTNHFVHVDPRWYQLIGLAAFSLFMVNGFTASYRLHWGLFWRHNHHRAILPVLRPGAEVQ